jgi:transcriptional regulator with XRE-family HTH domain
LIEMKESTKTEELEATLGEGIRAARLRKNISQADLADIAGVALGSLRNLESGSGATVTTLVRAVRALQLEDWLSSLQPPVSISPMRMLKAKQPRQRARKQKNDAGEG